MKKKYYIVSVLCQEVKAYTGTVLTKGNSKTWLGMSDGYPTCGEKNSAYHFASIPDKEQIANWDGMPWYHRFIPGTEEIFEVEEEIVTYRQERRIN